MGRMAAVGLAVVAAAIGAGGGAVSSGRSPASARARRRSSSRAAASAPPSDHAAARASSGHRVRPGGALRRARARGRHDLRQSGDRRHGAGLGLRRRPRRRDPHERARDHERRGGADERPGCPGGVRRVRRTASGSAAAWSDGTSSATSGVIRVSGPPTTARARAARRLGEGRRGRAGRRDRKPVRQAELADRRRRLGDGPLDRLPRRGRVRRLERDPDRRADQSRQLRRPALRRGRHA